MYSPKKRTLFSRPLARANLPSAPVDAAVAEPTQPLPPRASNARAAAVDPDAGARSHAATTALRRMRTRGTDDGDGAVEAQAGSGPAMPPSDAQGERPVRAPAAKAVAADVGALSDERTTTNADNESGARAEPCDSGASPAPAALGAPLASATAVPLEHPRAIAAPSPAPFEPALIRADLFFLTEPTLQCATRALLSPNATLADWISNDPSATRFESLAASAVLRSLGHTSTTTAAASATAQLGIAVAVVFAAVPVPAVLVHAVGSAKTAGSARAKALDAGQWARVGLRRAAGEVRAMCAAAATACRVVDAKAAEAPTQRAQLLQDAMFAAARDCVGGGGKSVILVADDETMNFEAFTARYEAALRSAEAAIAARPGAPRVSRIALVVHPREAPNPAGSVGGSQLGGGGGDVTPRLLSAGFTRQIAVRL
jgi:hypothetical protein